jgi:hypothetical protein
MRLGDTVYMGTTPVKIIGVVRKLGGKTFPEMPSHDTAGVVDSYVVRAKRGVPKTVYPGMVSRFMANPFVVSKSR